MVKKYLENYYNLLLEKKVNLEEDLSKHQTKLESYLNRINDLKNNSEDSLHGFYPYVVDEKGSDETGRYQSLIDSCKEEIKVIQNSINDVKFEIKELFNEIQISKEEENRKIAEKRKSDLEKERLTTNSYLNFSYLIQIYEDEKYNIKNKICENIIRNINSIKNRIDLSSKIIDIDPARCKLELNVVTNLLEKTDLEIDEVLYYLSPVFFSDEEKVERLIHMIFEKLNEKVNDSVIFHSLVEDGVNDISSVMKYHILFLVDRFCYVFINEFQAEKIDIEMKLQEGNIYLSMNYVGDKFSSDYVNINDNQDFIERKLESVNDISMINKQLVFLSSQIMNCDFENNKNMIAIAFPINS